VVLKNVNKQEDSLSAGHIAGKSFSSAFSYRLAAANKGAMVDLLCLVYFLPWMFIVNSVPSNGQDGYKSTSDTIRKLFHEDNYEKRLRPFHNVAPLNVTVSMAVVHMGSLSEVDMDFSVDVFFRQYWQDPRLKHNLTEPILLPGYARQAIWLPDTFFLNVKIAKYHNVPADNSRITIYSDGNVSWSSRYVTLL